MAISCLLYKDYFEGIKIFIFLAEKGWRIKFSYSWRVFTKASNSGPEFGEMTFRFSPRIPYTSHREPTYYVPPAMPRAVRTAGETDFTPPAICFLLLGSSPFSLQEAEPNRMTLSPLGRAVQVVGNLSSPFAFVSCPLYKEFALPHDPCHCHQCQKISSKGSARS